MFDGTCAFHKRRCQKVLGTLVPDSSLDPDSISAGWSRIKSTTFVS